MTDQRSDRPATVAPERIAVDVVQGVAEHHHVRVVGRHDPLEHHGLVGGGEAVDPEVQDVAPMVDLGISVLVIW